MNIRAGSAPFWERMVLSSYPQSWRLDGRAEDMIETCLAAAEAEERHTLGLYDILDLATFGLRARRRRLGELVPNTARMVLSWGGLLSGVITAATLAVAPNESAEARGRNLTVPWDRTVILLWLLLGIAVIVGLRRPLQLITLSTVILTAAAPLATHRVVVSLTEPDPTLFILVPLFVFALLSLDTRAFTAAPRSRRVGLILGAALIGFVVGKFPFGSFYFSSPPPMPPEARGALVVCAATALILLVLRRPSMPAALLVAAPWLLPASLRYDTGGKPTTLPLWATAIFGVTALALASTTWRPRRPPAVQAL